jgi:parallel beta-helix repeat protein
MIRTVTRTPTALFAFVLLIALSAPAVQAQQANLVVDDDGEAATGTVDCDATGTTDVFETLEAAVDEANLDVDQDDIYICPGTYGPDEEVEITESATVTGAGPSKVTVKSEADVSGGPAAITVAVGQTTLQNFTLDHTTPNGLDAGSIDIEETADGVEILNVKIKRGANMGPSTSAVSIAGTNVRVENCDITNGPIGFYGKPSSNYTITGNTIRGAGDEGIWIVFGNKIVVTDNTIKQSSDNEPTDDHLGIAIYTAESFVTLKGNDVTAATRYPFNLGIDLPLKDPADGSIIQLQTATHVRDLVISQNDVGQVAFITNSNAQTLRNETGNPANDASSVHPVRRFLEESTSRGGSGAYESTALEAATDGDPKTKDGVIHLTNGSDFDEAVTIGENEDIGFSVSSSASIRDLAVLSGDSGDPGTIDIVNGNLSVTKTLSLGKGTRSLGNALILAPGATVTDNGLLEGSLRATRTVEADDETEAFGGIGLSLTATGTAPGEVTVTRTDGDPITEGDGSINRVYDVEAATSTGLTVDVGLEYDDGSNGGDNELSTASVSDVGNLGIFRSTDDGTTWSEIASTSQNLSANRFTGQQLSELGRFTLAKTGGVLPVELAGVTARADGRDAVLSWTTASETNNAGFRIQQQTDTGFETVAFVEGRGTVSGETTYEHRVSNLAFGTHAFRLQQVDADGSTSLSGEARVDIRMDGAYEVSQVVPMPVSGRGRIDVAVNETQTVTVEVFDMLGRQMMTLHDGELRGEQTRTVRVPADTFSSGHYFVRVQGERFQVTRRMVIVQ